MLDEKKLWPTGWTFNDAQILFLRQKLEYTSIRRTDLQLILDYLPLFTDGVRCDPKFRQRRLTSKEQISEIGRIVISRSFPVQFKWDSTGKDVHIVMMGLLWDNFHFLALPCPLQ
jgi:hypothetical protein